jgi:hypothetical protein
MGDDVKPVGFQARNRETREVPYQREFCKVLY